MNILFIEDEQELASLGILQLESLGYTVFLARDITEARQILADPEKKVHYTISDQRLPDGQGVDLLIELKQAAPHFKCAVVSGCLTAEDMDILERNEIPYFHKPLLYRKVIDELRRIHVSKAVIKPMKPERDSGDSSDAPPREKRERGLRRFLPFKRAE